MILEEVVTVSEAAVIKGCTVSYIRRLCRENKLVCRETAEGVWLILKSSIVK